ncbi:YlbG family protein [Streptococcus catagoni]|uniref:YlbG family protein n=1 Tax=Streptococcus catagoni TaxID=2654874 RepID=UPI00140CE12B|nr:YlbG family protein [Streptococcus catagoni]
MFEKQKRIGLLVYLYYNRDARKVYKYGDLYYHSKRSRYLLLYVNKEDASEKIKEISKLRFVREVKVSKFDEIDHKFVGNLQRPEETL